MVGSEIHLLPGNYSNKNINGGEYVFDDGVFCFYGDLNILGGEVTGDHVMFYMVHGNFNALGGDLDLSAGQNGEVVDASGTVWDGWLIFMKDDNHHLVSISGNADTTMVGTVWAPDPPFNTNLPKCSFNGGGNMTGVNLQFICYSIELSGSSNMILHFDEDQQADYPVTLDLYE